MSLDPHRQSINSSLRFVHLPLQILAGYWAITIDYYPCQEAFVKNVTYFAYAMLAFNLILYAFFNKITNQNKFLSYLPLIVNLGLAAGMLYFTIEGYNRYNNCAQTRALYEFFFIEIVIAIVLFILIMAGQVGWADRYAHWPGNLAWPILFLKWGFPGAFNTPALVIGIVYAIISILSFLANAYHYKDVTLPGGSNILKGQWSLAMILMFGAEVLAIVMLVTTAKDGDWNWFYARAIFVIFAAVNIVDFFFWFYGYRRSLI